MKITLEQEFELLKTMRVFNKVLENIQQYNKDMNIIDIPEFCKLPEDKITTQVDKYVCRVIAEGRLNEVYNKLINL